MFNAYGILYNSNNVSLKNCFLILETERRLSSTLKLVKYGMLKINLDQKQCKICIKKAAYQLAREQWDWRTVSAAWQPETKMYRQAGSRNGVRSLSAAYRSRL